MYIVKNKEGHMMKIVVFPATPPCVATFSELVTKDNVSQFETKEEAQYAILELIIHHDESPKKFIDYKIEKLEGDDNE